jgi:hypothetical protein
MEVGRSAHAFDRLPPSSLIHTSLAPFCKALSVKLWSAIALCKCTTTEAAVMIFHRHVENKPDDVKKIGQRAGEEEMSEQPPVLEVVGQFEISDP